MKRYFKTTVWAVTAVLFCAAVAVTSCKKDNSSNIPDDTSSFWDDAYRQHQLNGKVKTVKTFSENSTRYNLLEYDSKGNLIKDTSLDSNNPTYYYGSTLTYDAQNRLTKIVYGNNTVPEREVAEFGYDGSHTAYIPTNIYDMEDLRLQKGVSSVNYKIQGKEPMNVKCTSVENNHIIFEGTVGGLASLLGNISKVEVDCNGNYPAHLKFMNMGTETASADVTFGSDGIPTKVTYTMDGGETVTTEYTSVAGFLQMTKQVDSSYPDDYTEYSYNDKGYLMSEVSQDGSGYYYSYEYDTHGNWTKMTEKYSFEGYERIRTSTREYTYWE